MKRLPAKVVLSGLLLTGCTTPRLSTPDAPPMARVAPQTGAAVTDVDYQVGAGDVLSIDLVGERGPQSAEVGKDGSIDLAGHQVWVDGLTTTEISVELRKEMGWEFQNCKVQVAEPNSQFIHLFVDGETSQAVPYRGHETVEDMLSRADCRSCRRGYRVRVVRPGKTIGAVPDIFAFQVDQDLKDRPTGREPIKLEPNDYVYLERDRGKPGELTKMTENRWYQKPGEWARQLRRDNDRSLAKRP